MPPPWSTIRFDRNGSCSTSLFFAYPKTTYTLRDHALAAVAAWHYPPSMRVTDSPLAGDAPVSDAKSDLTKSDLRSDRRGDGPTAFPLGPPFPTKVRPSWLLLLCLATLAAALAIDLTLAAESAVGVLYVVALLLASWLPRRRVTLGLALVATVFLAFGYLHSPLSNGLAPTPDMLNRAFFVLLLWLAA